MTITPLPALPPTAPGAATADDAAGQAAGGGFAAFLAGLMAPASDTVPANANRPCPAVVTAPVVATATDDAAPGVSDEDDSTAPAAASDEATVAVGPLVPLPAVALMTPLAPVVPAPTATAGRPAAKQTQPGSTPAEPTAVAAVPDAPVQLADAPPRAATEHAARLADPTPAVGAPTVTAAVTATAPATPQPTSAPAATPGPAGAPVLQQVAPALARVASRGDGVHRMSLTLHPADLGEVRLTVTVRGGHVDVQIAAGREARDLMREGSGELRHLLESVGRTAGAITFRDLTTGTLQQVQPSAASSWQQGGTTTDGRNGSPQPGSGGGQDPGSSPDGRASGGAGRETGLVEGTRRTGDAAPTRTPPTGTGPTGLDLTI